MDGRRRYRPRPPLLAMALASSLLVAACGGGAGKEPASGTGGKPTDTVSVVMGFKYSVVQWYSVYDYGKQKGIFAKHGIDPQFREGAGSASTVQLIANGNADFGAVVSTANLIKARSEGADLKMVAQDTPVGTIAVLSRADKPIRAPGDLEGKRIGYDPSSYAGELFSALLAKNNIQKGAVTQVSVPGNAYSTSLAAKRIDGYVSAPDTNVPLLRKLNVDPVAMDFRSFGIDAAPQEGLIVTERTLEAKPDVVRRFLAALDETVELLRDDEAAQKEAAAAGAEAHPRLIEEDVALQQLQLHFEEVRKGATSGESILPIDEGKFDALVKLLSEFGSLENPRPAAEYFTNEYLPKG